METEKNPRVILLFLEGGFYRAYEQSAFLSVKCLQNFKVTCRHFKSVNSNVAMIGFPIASLAKFATGNMIEQCEEMALLTLPDAQTLPDVSAFKAWKDALPTTTNEEPNSGPRQAGKSLQDLRSRLMGILLRIYRANRTPEKAPIIHEAMELLIEARIYMRLLGREELKVPFYLSK